LRDRSTHLEAWKAIEKKLTAKRKIRNKMAHAQTLFNEDKGEARLFPFYSITDPQLPDWNGGWTAKNIVAFSSEFSALGSEIRQFLGHLREDLGMWPTDWRPGPKE
jgi:hypothetical protein